MLVVDASVFIASLLAEERVSRESDAFLERAIAAGATLVAPALLLVEVTCALSRRTGNVAWSGITARDLVDLPELTLEPLTDTLLLAAAQRGADSRLGAVDALYLAVAEAHAVPLISWDRELIARAGAITPTAWLAQHAT
jgi:predicted nucleic acid-binding protein